MARSGQSGVGPPHSNKSCAINLEGAASPRPDSALAECGKLTVRVSFFLRCVMARSGQSGVGPPDSKKSCAINLEGAASPRPDSALAECGKLTVRVSFFV